MKAATAPSSIRIIAGSLRGSRLPVQVSDGLRPTPDRVRETLFNWLGSSLIDANVLDAFAGTGALGIEALSRGAAFVDFIEIKPALARALQGELIRLKMAERAKVHCVDALQALPQLCKTRAPTLVFVDPPFAAALHQPALAAMLACLGDAALIYLEAAKGQMPTLTPGWTIQKHSCAGAVEFALWRRQAVHAS